MALTTLIVDDEQLARDELAYLLKSVEGVDIVAQGKNGVEAVSLIKEHEPDLVFLDVQMPGLDGFGVIKKLVAQKVPMPQIVFATAFDQYAVKAFEVNALDYILKPFDKKRIAQTVQKAIKNIKDQEEEAPAVDTASRLESVIKLLESKQPQPRAKVLIRAAGRMILVDQRDICYASIEDGVITVYTQFDRGRVELPYAGRAGRFAGWEPVLARAPLVPGEHQSHQGSGAVVQVELSAQDGRQEAGRGSSEPGADEAVKGVVQTLKPIRPHTSITFFYCRVTNTLIVPSPLGSGASALPTTAPIILLRSVPFIA